MSCIHNVDNICKLRHINCCFPSDDCKHYKTLDTLVKEAINVDKQADTTKNSYCKFCFNARVYKPTEEELMNPFNTELTDGNDSSSICVGMSCEHLRFMISSGYGEPVRIEIDEYLPKLKEWHTFGKYYPKYCPECGRRLDEYEVSKENN